MKSIIQIFLLCSIYSTAWCWIIDGKGILVDNDNNRICAFAATHLGKGYFYLAPAQGKTYKAELNCPGGLQQTVDVPPIGADGVVLSINNDNIPNAALRIEAIFDSRLQEIGITEMTNI